MLPVILPKKLEEENNKTDFYYLKDFSKYPQLG